MIYSTSDTAGKNFIDLSEYLIIIEGLVIHLHTAITYCNEKYGRNYRINPVKSRDAIGIITEHSFNIPGQDFNLLPKGFRNITRT